VEKAASESAYKTECGRIFAYKHLRSTEPELIHGYHESILNGLSFLAKCNLSKIKCNYGKMQSMFFCVILGYDSL
jgi:hypothetical protein